MLIAPTYKSKGLTKESPPYLRPMKEVVKRLKKESPTPGGQEVIKLLDASIIYTISDIE